MISHLINVDSNAFITEILIFAVVLYKVLFTLQSVSNMRFLKSQSLLVTPWNLHRVQRLLMV